MWGFSACQRPQVKSSRGQHSRTPELGPLQPARGPAIPTSWYHWRVPCSSPSSYQRKTVVGWIPFCTALPVLLGPRDSRHPNCRQAWGPSSCRRRLGAVRPPPSSGLALLRKASVKTSTDIPLATRSSFACTTYMHSTSK